MLTAETTLPPVQHSSSPYSRTPDAQHVPSGAQPSHVILAQSSSSSLQLPLNSQQPFSYSHSSDRSVGASSSEKNPQSSRSTDTVLGLGLNVQVDTPSKRLATADLDDQPLVRASSYDAQRYTVDGSVPLAGAQQCQVSADKLCRKSASVAAVLPTRQQQLAAISRLRKPLAVVTQKNSLIRYTGDGRRYWRWKDVVARVLHICRGASADDYSLLLQTEHWLEACDSKHRYGSNLKPYFKAWLESDTHQSFFKWLDEGAGLHVDIKERPRSKLDADRVVYCGIERCFFEVTVIQGWFRYRISKRLVTTDSSLDQPPCPPNLGETMDSIRSQMLAPLRLHSPPVQGPLQAPYSTPPLSPAMEAVTLGTAQVLVNTNTGVYGIEPAADRLPGFGHAADMAGAAIADAPAPESKFALAACSTCHHVPLVPSVQSTTAVSSMPPSIRVGRPSVDGASNGSLSAKRPGLLTQEFCRAAGMPYAQGGGSMRGNDKVQCDMLVGDHVEAQALPFSSSPSAATYLSQPAGDAVAAASLVSSKSGSILPGADPAVTAGISSAKPAGEPTYPYLTDERYAGGWLNGTGQLCMRRHGVNSMPSGLFQFPSLVNPSIRLFNRDVGGSDDEDSDSLPYGHSLGESSVDASGGSSPVCSSPRPARCGSITPLIRNATISAGSVPHALIHGFPSMPRLGLDASMQEPLLQPPQRTLRFPSSSTTPDAVRRSAFDNSTSKQPCCLQQRWHPPLQRSCHSAEVPALNSAVAPSAIASNGIQRHPTASNGVTVMCGARSPGQKQDGVNGYCRGWEILRKSLRMRKLSQDVPRAANAASNVARKHSQRRIRAPIDGRVADVTHPRLVSNSAIPENLKLLDIVETVAAPGGARLSTHPVAQAPIGEPGVSCDPGEGESMSVGGDVEVRDLADMLEERMVNTGQLVKVKTQAQLEEMLPCAPKVLSKDSSIGKKPGIPRQHALALAPVLEHAADCMSSAIQPARQVQSVAVQCNVGPPGDNAISENKSVVDSEAMEIAACISRNQARNGHLAAAKDESAALEKTREKWIYVWDMHSRLYINRKMPGRFHHSSFVAGGAVKAAGSIVVEDGVLKQLTTWSGHYRPRASDIALFLQWLESNHVDMTNVELLLVKPNKPNSKMNKAP